MKFENKGKWLNQIKEHKQLSLFDKSTQVTLDLALPEFISKELPSLAPVLSKKQKSKEQLDLEKQLKQQYHLFHINGAKKTSIYWNNIKELMKKLDKFK